MIYEVSYAQASKEADVTLVLIMDLWELGFDDVDSIYASPDDFRHMRERNKAKGLHLLEFFVNKCHEIGVKSQPFFWLIAQIYASSLNYYIMIS